MKITLEKEDIIKYFDDMDCSNCPFEDRCSELINDGHKHICESLNIS